jgi:hypothetical protein
MDLRPVRRPARRRTRERARDLGAWIDALSADLVDEAARSERARAALQELLGA